MEYVDPQQLQNVGTGIQALKNALGTNGMILGDTVIAALIIAAEEWLEQKLHDVAAPKTPTGTD